MRLSVKNKISSRSRFTPQTAIISVIFIIIAVIAGIFIVEEGKGIDHRVSLELEAIANLKVDQITDWRRRHIIDGEILQHDIPLISRIRKFIRKDSNVDKGEDILSWMRVITDQKDYSRCRLYNVNQQLVLSYVRDDLYDDLELAKSAGQTHITLTDLHMHEPHGIPHMEMVVPLKSINDPGSPIFGYIVFQIDPRLFLYPQIQRWPAQSTSSECLLFQFEGRDVVFLNELRHRKSSALIFRKSVDQYPKMAASMAYSGKTGIVSAIDYRGAEVLAYISKIPESPWYLVSKIDKHEYASVHRALWRNYFFAGILLLILAYFTISHFSRQQQLKFMSRQLALEKEKNILALQYEQLARHANDAILICDPELRIIDANVKASGMFGYTGNEITQFRITDLEISDPSAEKSIADQISFFSSGVVFESGLMKKDGTCIQVEVSAHSINYEGLKQVIFIIRDITDRKRAENALLESENRYHSLFNSMQEGFAYCKMIFEDDQPLDFIFLEVNKIFEHLIGIRDVTGKKVTEVIEGIRVLDDQLFRICGRVALSGVPEKTEIYVHSLAIWFSISVYSPGQGYFISVFDVITERKIAEEMVRQSEKLLRQSQRVASVGHYELDVSTQSWTSSSALDEIFGIPETFTKTISSWLSFIHPEDRDRMQSYFFDYVAGKKMPFDMEYRIIRLNDEVPRWVHGLGELNIDEDGKVIKMFGTIQDITSYKNIEETLKHQNEEMSQFIYTVSHDLKSPLVTIKTFLGYLEEDFVKDDEERMNRDMEYVKNAAEKMDRRLDEILALSRIGRRTYSFEEVSFLTIVSDALKLVAGRISGSGMEVRLPEENFILCCDHQRLVDVFQNLFDNAVKFRNTKEKPVLEINIRKTEKEFVISVKDNGIGIEPAYQKRIFHIFEKLDPNSEGTGVGLAIVQRIIEIHKGRVWIESDGKDQGTIVFLTLPVRRIKT